MAGLAMAADEASRVTVPRGDGWLPALMAPSAVRCYAAMPVAGMTG